MKTKSEVIEFVKNELVYNNGVLVASLGNGGSGAALMSDMDEDDIENFVNELEECEFTGLVEPSEDIIDNPCFENEENPEVYQFEGEDGFYYQIMVVE